MIRVVHSQTDKQKTNRRKQTQEKEKEHKRKKKDKTTEAVTKAMTEMVKENTKEKDKCGFWRPDKNKSPAFMLNHQVYPIQCHHAQRITTRDEGNISLNVKCVLKRNRLRTNRVPLNDI